MHTRLHELQAIVNQTLASESWIAVIHAGACFDAIVAPSASIQINDHRFLAIIQAILHHKLEQFCLLESGPGHNGQVIAAVAF